MFEHQGIWLPDGEKHFPEWMNMNGERVDGKGTYQIKKIRAALEFVKNFGTAIDVGAHVGLWSMQLKRFRSLYAFEPVQAFRECWSRNMWGQRGMLYPMALGAAQGRVALKIPQFDGGGLDTGGTHVAGAGDIEMRTLDSFDLHDVDFIKVDCEGYEHHVIEGARETLERCRPCMIVEQKQHKLGQNFGIKGTPAVDALIAMGAKVRREMSGDFILSWD